MGPDFAAVGAELGNDIRIERGVGQLGHGHDSLWALSR